jgi:hypothetical protein
VKPFKLFCVLTAAAPFAAAVFCAAQEATNLEAAPFDYQAITYFQDRCLRCHGTYGVNYDLKHMAQSSDEKLQQVIASMADGPGQEALDARQLAAQTAFHRSLLDGKPFVIINNAKTDGDKLTLSGEATPESKLQIALGEKTFDATLIDHQWSAALPAGSDWKSATLTAILGDKKTQLKASAAYSHGK